MSPQEIEKLLNRYLDRECTEEEKVLVESWYHNLKDPALQSDLDPSTARVIEKRLWSSIKPVDPTRFSYVPYFKIAALVMLAMIAAVFVLVKVESRTDTISGTVVAEEARTVGKSDAVLVGEIFSALEKKYGIEIQYDKEAMSSCTIPYTDLTEDGLYEQIEIICNALGARYEKSESSIVIKGEGCK